MMAMLMSSGSGGVSEEFLTSIKEALQSGGTKQLCKYSFRDLKRDLKGIQST
jgi:hypothetical protein